MAPEFWCQTTPTEFWCHGISGAKLYFADVAPLLEFDTKSLAPRLPVGINKTVRFIRTDNGTEFVNQVMSKYYKGVGIFHQKSVPRTPQQNGVVERRNRTLVEAARTMMIFS
ncbi:retrovirus-related pol polyprotein from transposon TNT 1-94, partial [Tanacetum coccineum]